MLEQNCYLFLLSLQKSRVKQRIKGKKKFLAKIEDKLQNE